MLESKQPGSQMSTFTRWSMETVFGTTLAAIVAWAHDAPLLSKRLALIQQAANHSEEGEKVMLCSWPVGYFLGCVRERRIRSWKRCSDKRLASAKATSSRLRRGARI